MLRLVQAGLIAGCLQAIAVAVVATIFVLYLRYDFSRPSSTSTMALLTWINLLTALGLALTANRFVEASALHGLDLESAPLTAALPFVEFVEARNQWMIERSQAQMGQGKQLRRIGG